MENKSGLPLPHNIRKLIIFSLVPGEVFIQIRRGFGLRAKFVNKVNILCLCALSDVKNLPWFYSTFRVITCNFNITKIYVQGSTMIILVSETKDFISLQVLAIMKLISQFIISQKYINSAAYPVVLRPWLANWRVIQARIWRMSMIGTRFNFLSINSCAESTWSSSGK